MELLGSYTELLHEVDEKQNTQKIEKETQRSKAAPASTFLICLANTKKNRNGFVKPGSACEVRNGPALLHRVVYLRFVCWKV